VHIPNVEKSHRKQVYKARESPKGRAISEPGFPGFNILNYLLLILEELLQHTNTGFYFSSTLKLKRIQGCPPNVAPSHSDPQYLQEQVSRALPCAFLPHGAVFPILGFQS
jgi:hypothetical protein